MKKLLILIILLLASPVLAQQCSEPVEVARMSPYFISGSVPVAAACDDVGGNVLYETFETGASDCGTVQDSPYDVCNKTWAAQGTDTSNIVATGGKGSCSANFLRWTSPYTGDYNVYNNSSESAIVYITLWVRSITNGLSDTDILHIVGVSSGSGYTAATVQLKQSGANLTLMVQWHQNYTYFYSAPYTIATNTWYKVWLKIDTTNDVCECYFSTSATEKGSNQCTGGSASMTRLFQTISVGRVTSTGTVGDNTFDLDSISVDTAGFVDVEE